MKQALLLALLGSILLSGCATPSIPANHTATEKKDIAEGKLVTFVDRRQPTGALRLDKTKYPNGVFVCASGWAFPTDQCYPLMGKLVSQDLEARGIPIAKDQATADVTLYYNASFWFEGRMPDKNFTYALEMWLAKGGMDIKEHKGAGLEVGVTYLAAKSLQIGGLALFGGLMTSGGGYWADRHWVSITMIEVDNKTAKIVNKGVWSDKPDLLPRYEFAGRYIGPVKATDSSLKLFELAMKETLNQVVAP